jgi:hypothetical protein
VYFWADLIKRDLGPERMTLWDSKKRGTIKLILTRLLHYYFVVGGRLDVMKLIKEVYHSWDAKVVFIASNNARESRDDGGL